MVVVCGQLPSWRATITSTREGSSTPVANTLTQAFPRTQEEEEEAEDGKMRRKEHEWKERERERAGVYLSKMIFSNEMACDGERKRKRCCWQRCWRQMNWYRNSATEYPTANANSIGNRATERAESHSKKEGKEKKKKGKEREGKNKKKKGKRTREREKLSKYEATSVPTTNRIRRSKKEEQARQQRIGSSN